ncbi:MAG: OsmC family peroxiredoxin [Microbacteriaceae bacterium]
MSIAERTAETIWEGSLNAGKGAITGHSGALGELPVTWAARTERPGGKTSPEELAAAAHSSCYSMALSLCLGEHKLTPQKLTVSSTVTLDAVDGVPTVVSSALTVKAIVPGLEDSDFQAIIDQASALCPISRLFAGTTITVDATLVTE